MRTGLIVSTALHAGLIALAILGLGIGKPIEATPVESIAVDLVPVSEFSNIRVGSLESTVVETEAPSAVDAEKPAEIAQPTGNTAEDQITPEDTPTPTPAPTVQTAPAPEATEPDPTPEPVEETAPVPVVRPAEAAPPPPEPEPEPEPQPEPEPAPVETPQLVADTPAPNPADAAPKPIVRTAALAEKRAQFKKQQEAAKEKAAQEAKAAAEAKKAEEEKKKAEDARKAAEKKKADEQKRIEQAKAEEAKQADAINDIINNEQSRGATTGEGGEKTLGKADGRSATLSQSEMDALSAAMLRCFSPPPGATDEQASAVVEVQLSQSGMVVGQPRVLSVTGAMTGQQTGSAAARAVLRCGQAGYTMLPQEKYAGDNGWNTVKVTFNARDAF